MAIVFIINGNGFPESIDTMHVPEIALYTFASKAGISCVFCLRTQQSSSPSKPLMLTVYDIIIKGLHWFLNSYQSFVSGNGLVKWGIEKGNGPSSAKPLLFSINI